ncbi:hypothetical protein [Nocardia fluminea]|uniref:hypothetical protein n=1 Tax=Nocardia fluminea TaxID=134984 RepID=UPI003D10D4FB
MTLPTVTDEAVYYSAAQTVDSPERVSHMVEMLIEQCQDRARTAAAEQTTAGAGQDYFVAFLGVDHTIAALPSGILISVVVAAELRPTF